MRQLLLNRFPERQPVTTLSALVSDDVFPVAALSKVPAGSAYHLTMALVTF